MRDDERRTKVDYFLEVGVKRGERGFSRDSREQRVLQMVVRNWNGTPLLRRGGSILDCVETIESMGGSSRPGQMPSTWERGTWGMCARRSARCAPLLPT